MMDSKAQAIPTATAIYINEINILAIIVFDPIYFANNYIKLYLIGNKINGNAIKTTKLYTINNIFGHTKPQ